MRTRGTATAPQAPTAIGRLALLGGALVLASLLGAPASAPAGGPVWQVALAGPCAQVEPHQPCPAGTCTGSTPARSRFEAGDVAANRGGGGGAAPPEPVGFSGPGSCADPSTPCGEQTPTRVASTEPTPRDPVVPPPPASGPALPPNGGLPNPAPGNPAGPPVAGLPAPPPPPPAVRPTPAPPPPAALPPAPPAPLPPPGVIEQPPIPTTPPGSLPGMP